MSENKESNWIKRNITNARLWWVFFVVVLIFSIVIIELINLGLNDNLSMAWSMIPFFLVSGYSLYQGIGKIPHKWKWNIEVWGHCEKAYSSGVCFLFPWFNIITYVDVYLGEQPLSLFEDEKREGEGDIEFDGASAFVDVTVFYKIEDTIKAAYNVSDLEAVLEEKLDSKVRSFLGLYTIERAISLKAKANILDILNGDESADKKGEASRAPTKKELEKNPFWHEIHQEWGVAITDIAIADIVLSGELKSAREAISIAEREAEKAEHEKKATVINAEASQEALKLNGLGYSEQVESLKKMGLEPQQAVAYLQERLKWENVGKNGATVILDSGDSGSLSSIGTKIGAGMKSIPDPKS